jgi:hypothetical protein
MSQATRGSSVELECGLVDDHKEHGAKESIMETFMKYAGAAILAALLSLPSTTGQARDRNTGAPASATVSNGPYAAYYDKYAYDPRPGYYGQGYAAAPSSRGARSRGLNYNYGEGCIQSPASLEYTSCD